MKIRITSYHESARDIHFIRDTVFGEEQKVPREIDWDGKDSECLHVLATDDDGTPIGAGRMQPDGRIGRLAVVKNWRRRGVGRKMLESLLDSARANAVQQVYLHSQVHAIPFYEKSGFRATGEEFMEGGMPHVTMTKNIG